MRWFGSLRTPFGGRSHHSQQLTYTVLLDPRGRKLMRAAERTAQEFETPNFTGPEARGGFLGGYTLKDGAPHTHTTRRLLTSHQTQTHTLLPYTSPGALAPSTLLYSLRVLVAAFTPPALQHHPGGRLTGRAYRSSPCLFNQSINVQSPAQQPLASTTAHRGRLWTFDISPDAD